MFRHIIIIVMSALFMLQTAAADNGKVVVGYVTSWSKVVPDPFLLTHICYAFGGVNKNFNGIDIGNPKRLRKIVDLKKENHKLKVLLSIGGWGAGGFSEMASSEITRKAFASDCRRVMDEFGLDGIDIDWEYPGSGMSGISHTPADRTNFTLLMRDIRASIGASALLSIATAAGAGFYDFTRFIDCVDLVNVMTYDMAEAPRHHAALKNSTLTGNGLSCEKAIKAHICGGVPADKLVLGMPFYGRGCGPLKGFRNYKDIKEFNEYTEKWDKKAGVPYLVDSNGNVVLCFDNVRSLKKKCKYIKKRKLRGAMYWDCDGDDPACTLAKTVWNGLH